MDPSSLFSLNDQLEALSQLGDPPEILDRTVDFEYFRPRLVERQGDADRNRTGQSGQILDLS